MALTAKVSDARAAANAIADRPAPRDTKELVYELARAVEALAVATAELIAYIEKSYH